MILIQCYYLFSTLKNLWHFLNFVEMLNNCIAHKLKATKCYLGKKTASICNKIKLFNFFFLFFSCPSPGLLPVLGPLGSGTDATHQPGPALWLLGLMIRLLQFYLYIYFNPIMRL